MTEGESHSTEIVGRSFPTGFRREWFQDERVWGVFLLLKQMEVYDVCGMKNLFFFWVPCFSHWFPHSVLTLVGGGGGSRFFLCPLHLLFNLKTTPRNRCCYWSCFVLGHSLDAELPSIKHNHTIVITITD
jgi:hypothetical protein